MKQKMNLRQELDLTRDGTAEMTRWCIIIALHQCFGVGKDRLNRIELRAEELGLESLNIAMQANGKGMPSTDQSRAMRDNWMPEGVEPEFRVPVLRAPRTRREQQLRMAGDVAASMVWTLYAKACMELLGYGAGRLNRLKQEALANYRQVNEEGRADWMLPWNTCADVPATLCRPTTLLWKTSRTKSGQNRQTGTMRNRKMLSSGETWPEPWAAALRLQARQCWHRVRSKRRSRQFCSRQLRRKAGRGDV